MTITTQSKVMAAQIVELNSDTVTHLILIYFVSSILFLIFFSQLALSLILQYVQANVETEHEIQVNNVMIIMQLSMMGVQTAR